MITEFACLEFGCLLCLRICAEESTRSTPPTIRQTHITMWNEDNSDLGIYWNHLRLRFTHCYHCNTLASFSLCSGPGFPMKASSRCRFRSNNRSRWINARRARESSDKSSACQWIMFIWPIPGFGILFWNSISIFLICYEWLLNLITNENRCIAQNSNEV